MYSLIQISIYELHCNVQNVCDVIPTPEVSLSVPELLTNTVQLDISANLARLLAYAFHCITFHFVGIALCILCTMSFRTSIR